MTFLKINRLIVVQKGIHVYDEIFHNGINIIRGDNGVGKSTISNFIYYGLGGDYNDWLPEAKKCDFVFIEINVNHNAFTLKRTITEATRQPMEFFYGSYDEAVKSPSNWLIYSYNRSKDKESFSQVLFRILEFPEVVTEADDYITFNQILRLLYIDQISPLDALMKNIEFDSPLIRQTVGDLLLGIYDNSLFNDQLAVRNKKKELSSYEQELKILKVVFSESNQSINIDEIKSQITDAEQQIQKIDKTLAERESLKKAVRREEQFKRIKEAEEEVNRVSNQLSNDLEEYKKVELELFDTTQFIDELNRQDLALTESLSTRIYFGEYKVTFCPSCLSKLDGDIETNTCHLCKQPISEDFNKSRIFRIKQELNAQISESNLLNEKNDERLKNLAATIDSNRRVLSLKKKILDSVVNSIDSDLENKHNDLLITKGILINRIENVSNQLKSINSFWLLNSKREAVKSQMEALQQLIEEKIQRQRGKHRLVLTKVSEFANILLRGDGEYESFFNSADYVEFYFDKNTYALNGRNNFSASSLVILKNSIRLAIFFASLELEFMRFPRFIYCDNIEDKGMNEKRSKNFQRQIVALSESERFKDIDFQLIFTTSMIDESLNNEKYTIGDYYVPGNKALKIID
jgi:hypothetical protein